MKDKTVEARNWLAVDWHGAFAPTVPMLEIVLRGSLTYLALFFMLRFIRNRSAGSTGTTDMLLIVLIADAVQNAMSGKYQSISEGLVLVLTIFFWAFFIDWLGFHSPVLRRFLKSSPAALVRHGRILPEAMQRELMSRADLMQELRKQDVHDLAGIERACIESDGSLTVTMRERKNP